MGKARWGGTLGVAGVLMAFGVGLPLIDGAIAGDQSLPPGTVLQVGQADRRGVRQVSFKAAPGWVLRKEASDLSINVTVSKGATVFAVSVVALTPDPRTGKYPKPNQLWKGLGRLVPLQWNAQLRPETVRITTHQGVSGLTGGLTGAGHIGSASVFAIGDQGAEAVSAGPPADFSDEIDQVRSMVRSIHFRDFHGDSNKLLGAAL